MDDNYDPKRLSPKRYDYNVLSENKEESADKEKSVDLSDMPPPEGDEEVRKGKGIKILTPNKVLTRLLLLLAQTKAGSSSYKLKNEIRQILGLFYQHKKSLKSLQQFNQVTIIMDENIIVIRDPKTFYVAFDWHNDVDES